MSSRDDFIAGAKKPRPAKKEAILYPWDEPHVREDVKKVINIHLPEPLYLKLKYLAAHKKDSVNKLCVETLKALIESELENL